MLRIILLIILLLPTTSNADQGLKISCLNMKDVIIGRKHDPLNFTMQAVGLEYFDKDKGEFIMIEANKLDIGENQRKDKLEEERIERNRAAILRESKYIGWTNAHDQGNYRSIHSEEYQSRYKKKKYEYY